MKFLWGVVGYFRGGDRRITFDMEINLLPSKLVLSIGENWKR
jgi:hypothetical protein